MENVVLIVHLLLALALIAVVLLQRSEGGGLGIGGGGGGAVTGRTQQTAVGKLTWMLAIAFICTSLGLTILAAQNAGNASVADGITTTEGADGEIELPAAEDLLPPTSSDEPLLPSAD